MHPSDPSRRRFLRAAARCALAAAGADLLLRGADLLVPGTGGFAAPAEALADDLAALARGAPRARFWVGLDGSGVDAAAAPAAGCAACHEEGAGAGAQGDHDHGAARPVRCLLCARRCLLTAGERGACRVRMNVDGELRSLVYGRPVSVHVDPVEKKPFFHFLPGRQAFSLATVGCPLRCRFCQNWEISQASPEDHPVERVPAARMAAAAAGRDAPIVAFTYNEPTVFIEYLLDVAAAARERGLRPVLVSCGFMNEAPLAAMCDVLDAVKIDLKGFSPDFYRRVCDAELAPVLRSIRQVARSGTHVEIVNLVVPTLNDDETMLGGLVDWVAGELGPDVPVHFTRFHPDYRLLNLPPTPVATLERAYDLARARGLRYPYVGNVPGHEGNNTYCPRCGAVVVRRQGFLIVGMNLDGGRCAACGATVAGVWS